MNKKSLFLRSFMVMTLLVLIIPQGVSAEGTPPEPVIIQQGSGMTSFQQQFQQMMAERMAAGLPVPSEVTYEYEVVEPEQAPMLRSMSVAAEHQTMTVIAKTTIQFDNPQQAGYEAWPPFVVDDEQDVVPPVDYTDQYYQSAEENVPGIWQNYEFGQEPRKHTITETLEVTLPPAQEMERFNALAAGETTTTEQVLMGFTYEGPNIRHIIEDKAEVCLFGYCWTIAEIKAGFELTWALGLRLPAEVTMSGPAQMVQGSAYMLSAALEPQDWDEQDYLDANVAPEEGNEFILRFTGFAGVKAELFGHDVCPLPTCYVEVEVDGSETFETPFGTGASFPIPAVTIPVKNFDFALFSFNLDIALTPLLGSTKITADWQAVPGSDCTGNGEVTFTEPGVPVSFGPLKACNLGTDDQAQVQLSNFRYWFNQFSIALDAVMSFKIADFDIGTLTIPITTFDLSGIVGGLGLYLGAHQHCEWQDGNPFHCGPAGPDNILLLSASVIDDQGPITTATLNGTEGKNDWYISDVSVTLQAVDQPPECGEGVAGIEYSFDGVTWTAYTAPFTITKEGMNQLQYRATDLAGNTGLTGKTPVPIDKTPPLLTGAPTTDPNSYGWYKTDVTVHFEASDAVSGLAWVTPDQILTNEGADQSVTGEAEDMAGNTSQFIVDGINIDKTAPTILITAPQAVTYPNTASFHVTWSATDALSGIANEVGTLDGTLVQHGQLIELLLVSAGPHNFIAQAVDKADNASQSTVAFMVSTDINGLIAVKEYMCKLGWINKPGVCNSLDAKLNAARNAIARGKEATAVNQLQAFLHELDAQKDKAVETRAYNVLKADALYVIADLEP